MKKIKVGYKDYKLLEQEKCVMNYHGSAEHTEGHIFINKSSTPIEQADTLIHELLHAICFVYSIEEGDNEERTVTMMANGLTAAFKDNPKLLNKIEDLLKKDLTKG